MLPFSEACERNKYPILEILIDVFADCTTVLEIGSGTGQHALFFSEKLPHLVWQPTDLEKNLATITKRIKSKDITNVKLPLKLNVSEHPWKLGQTEAIFTANTLHIMHWKSVENLFLGASKILISKGILAIYGPFKYGGYFTTESNKKFDEWLKSKDTKSGVRDFEEVNKLALQNGFEFIKDYKMPANNQLIIWQKT